MENLWVNNGRDHTMLGDSIVKIYLLIKAMGSSSIYCCLILIKCRSVHRRWWFDRIERKKKVAQFTWSICSAKWLRVSHIECILIGIRLCPIATQTCRWWLAVFDNAIVSIVDASRLLFIGWSTHGPCHHLLWFNRWWRQLRIFFDERFTRATGKRKSAKLFPIH